MKNFGTSGCLSDISNKVCASEGRFTGASTEITVFKTPAEELSWISPFEKHSRMSTAFFSAGQGKRERENGTWGEGKKGFGPVTKLVTELVDPETGKSIAFRCYYEKDVGGAQGLQLNFIQNECDDDCPTDALQIETCKRFLLRDLEHSLQTFINN